MTVCVGVQFLWNYAEPGKPDDWGTAGLTASDRMITFDDIEYEPYRQKVAFFPPHTVLLIAGDYVTHSQAIKQLTEQTKGRPILKPEDMATRYGYAIQGIARKQSEDKILAPLGLNLDTFIAQQKEMTNAFVDRLTTQIQDFEVPVVAAIVLGIEEGNAQLYTVDKHGTARNFNDVGFAAIGLGAWHAQSTLMQLKYSSTAYYSQALIALYLAKKAAETAPGVGIETDIQVILRTGTHRLDQGTFDKVEEAYREYLAGRSTLTGAAVNKVQEYLNAEAAKAQKKQAGAISKEGN